MCAGTPSRTPLGKEVVHMTVGKRILELRGKQSRRTFAKKIGIVENTLRNYEEGLSLPNSDVIATICREFEVSAEWLVLGESDTDGSLENSRVNAQITKLELKIKELEEALITAQAEAIRAYRLATAHMQPDTDTIQKPKNNNTDILPVKQTHLSTRADEKS